MHQRHAVLIVAQTARRRFNGGLVAVKCDQPSRRQAADDLQRVSGAAERSVHVNAVRLDLQRVQALLQQHRLMTVVLLHVRTPALP